MKEIVPDLFLLRGFPPAAFNAYVIRSGAKWVLVDTSTKYARRRIIRQLPGTLAAIFITHAHRDHAGSMHAVATKTGAPVWARALVSSGFDFVEPAFFRAVDAQEGHIVRPAQRKAGKQFFDQLWRDKFCSKKFALV